MLLAPSYGGSDLPVYGPESVITDVRNLRGAEPGDTLTPATFLRDVHISVAADLPGATNNLDHLLQRADEELEIVADLCGAQVIGHQWGLLHDPEGVHEKRGNSGATALVPPDHHLVAEVDIVRDAVDMHPLNALRVLRRTGLGAAKLAYGLKRYERQSRDRLYRLHDMMPSQFVVGMPAAGGNEPEGFWLVDIEPRLVFS